LKKYDFAIFDAGNTDNIQAHIENSEIIIGVHGSDLADIIFAHINCKVIELIPTDHLKPYYKNIANNKGLNYECLFCESLSLRNTIAGPSNMKITVNIDDLENLIVNTLKCI
jgi:capsular polysaccharide biosynthesis protein